MWRPGAGPCSLSAVLAMDMTTHTAGRIKFQIFAVFYKLMVEKSSKACTFYLQTRV